MLRNIISVLWFVGGIALAIYVGLYIMFIGGIIDIIDQVKAPVTDGAVIAWAIVKILFGSIVGYLIFLINLGISMVIKDA